MACKTCRTRKIKCDRARPTCQNCKLRRSVCSYAGERRKRRWSEHNTSLSPEVDAQTDVNSVRAMSFPDNDDGQSQPAQRRFSATVNHINLGTPTRDSRQAIHRSQPASQYNSRSAHHALPPASCEAPPTLLDQLLDAQNPRGLCETGPALWARVTDGDEYTGPSSGIFAISDTGLNWIRKHVPDSDVLCRTAQEISNSVLDHIRHPKSVPPGLPFSSGDLSDPCMPTDSKIMEYVEAYFSTVQVIFPVLNKPTFLAQLAQFGASSDNTLHSWSALFNAVLASGCRATLSDETPESFRESTQEAWKYFQKALSYESRIFHGSTDLLAAQAYAVMTVFAQGLSSPQRLEYTLCSTASRLAQSLALHCHTPPGWSLTEREREERDRVFWVIFCLDKTIALRCGRPAVIHDTEISCRFPRAVRISYDAGDSEDTADKVQSLDFFLCFTKFARICGSIAHELYSATALNLSHVQLQGIGSRLLEQLEVWCRMIPEEIRPGRPIGRRFGTLHPSKEQVVVLHYSYYYALCAVYRRFSPMFTQEEGSLPPPHHNHPSHIEAARSMALLTKHLDVESFTPAWLVFYYPFTALTTIFIHVLSCPLEKSTPYDIALMETIVGFLGRLEYMTSGEAAFTNTREFVRQARLFVERHSTKPRLLSPATTASVVRENNSIPDDHSLQSLDPIFLDGSDNLSMLSQTHIPSGRVGNEMLTTLACDPDRTELPRSLYADMLGVLSPSVDTFQRPMGGFMDTG